MPSMLSHRLQHTAALLLDCYAVLLLLRIKLVDGKNQDVVCVVGAGQQTAWAAREGKYHHQGCHSQQQ